MTLEQLKIFVAVAQIEHFTRAAEKLNVSQSAVSAAIAALEQEYNVALFDRTRRHVELTDAGNVLLADAENIVAGVNRAARHMEDLAELRRGRLSIAASQTVANYWLPEILSLFHEKYPVLSVELWDGNSTHVEKRVTIGKADIGIIEQEAAAANLTAEVLATDRLVLVVGPKHPWFKRDAIGWHELTETSWVMRERGSGTRALFEAALIEHGITPNALDVALDLPTGEAVRNAVAASEHAAVMSSLVAAVAVRAGGVRQFDSIEVRRNFNVVTLTGKSPTRASAAFQNHLRQSRRVYA